MSYEPRAMSHEPPAISYEPKQIMINTVIKIEHLTKKYDLGVINTGTLTRDLNTWWARLLGKPDPYAKIGQEQQNNIKGSSILALDDVSFTVQQGEVLGIIGPNGSGKSTLLKILSQVTAPTSGVVKVKGRIGSLLEVGTGFHPELTGRENIYLNGAILGMTRGEVDSKFDEIVDFSGVEKFIDTPVKRYSSGMYVRLAFAVAAHLDPEILIVDEVLAVGDAEFQKKCLGKMGDVASEGRTVLFVSHNMNAIEQLCHSGMLLEKGKIEIYSNKAENVINQYLNPRKLISNSKWQNEQNNNGSPYFSLQELYLTDKESNLLQKAVKNNSEVYINFEFIIQTLDPALEIAYALYDDKHRLVYISQHTDTPRESWPILKNGHNKLITKIPPHFLNEGKYYIKPRVSIYKRMWVLDPIKHNILVDFEIVGGLSESPYWMNRRKGIVAPILEWDAII
jgi:lipopolysaccharide transport system ATP-binding protein